MLREEGDRKSGSVLCETSRETGLTVLKVFSEQCLGWLVYRTKTEKRCQEVIRRTSRALDGLVSCLAPDV